LHSLYVRAEATRQGLGSALLAHAMTQARERGMQSFPAWATPFSLPVSRRNTRHLTTRIALLMITACGEVV
jgi:putative acetyltransferase